MPNKEETVGIQCHVTSLGHSLVGSNQAYYGLCSLSYKELCVWYMVLTTQYDNGFSPWE